MRCEPWAREGELHREVQSRRPSTKTWKLDEKWRVEMIVLRLRREDLGLEDCPSIRHTDLGLGGGGQTTTTTRVEIFSQVFFFSNEINSIYPAHNLQNHGVFFSIHKNLESRLGWMVVGFCYSDAVELTMVVCLALWLFSFTVIVI